MASLHLFLESLFKQTAQEKKKKKKVSGQTSLH